MNFQKLLFSLFILITVFSCRKVKVSEADEQDWFAGGSQTVFVTGVGAYSQAFPTLSDWHDRIHEIGDLAFEATFVSAPAPKNPGLGPIFNSVSCISCHINDGRGRAPNAGEQSISLLMRLSQSGQDPHGGPLPIPLYGLQLQTKGIFGKIPEGTVQVSYIYTTATFPDGEVYELRTPTFTLQNLYASLTGTVLTSPRIAPPVFGMGLLEAIPEATLLSYQDIGDSDGDGISGKANYVWNIKEQKQSIGRFGWKANTPSVLQQVAAAYNEDMGITNFLFPKENSFGQSQYDNLSDDPEITDSLIYAATFYMQTVAVPGRRNVKDPDVMRGKQLFKDAKCIKCHVPSHRTGVNVAFKDISNQLIFPYTDLLLHDMGPNLADNRPDYLADGQEWRTLGYWSIRNSQWS